MKDKKLATSTFPRPTVLIFRERLLKPSETFVLSQTEALERFVPYYLGSTVVKGISVPLERTMLIGGRGPLGKLREIAFKFLGVAPHAMRRCRELNPVLIHAHFGPDGALALPLAQKLGIPLLVTFHGFDATRKDEYCSSSAFRTYVRRREQLRQEACGFLAVSNYIKDKLIDKGFPAEKIAVHYIGVNATLFKPDTTIQREPIVLFVGRLVENKGCEYLIRAMKIVQQRVPEVRLVVIGDGPLRIPLEALAVRTLRNCQFVGVQSSETVRHWMHRAKVFSVPSVSVETGESEGFGLVFVEAQAVGLPVVSFTTGGIPEAVADHETGFLVAPRDWESLAQNLSVLLTDEVIWQRFSVAGRERANSLFNLQNQSRKLEDIYYSVMKSGQLRQSDLQA